MSQRPDSPANQKKSALRAARPSLTLFFLVCGLLFPTIAFALVDINTATLAQLDTLKGIGAVKAQAIIDYRQANGPFYYIEDIQKVKGIGPVTYAGIKDDITVGNVTPPPPPPAPKTMSISNTLTKSTSSKPSATPSATTAATASTTAAPADPYYPLVPWLMGLAAAFGLGIAGTLYLRPFALPKETTPGASEFEVE